MAASLAMLESLQKKHGGSACYSVSDHYKRHVVVPVPCLPIRFLTKSNGWPLASITSSSGPPKSLKSSFSFEIARWYLQAGGAVLYIDTEGKLAPTLLYSILPPEYMKPPYSDLFTILKTTSTEEWQSGVSSRVEGLEDILLDKKKKPEFPTLVVVDSIGAAGSEAMSAAIAKEGNAPGKGFSDVAQLNTQFMRYLSSGQVGMPVTTHFVNHEKSRMDGTQGKVNPGGDALPYHTCLDLRFSPARQADKTGGSDKKGAVADFTRTLADGTRILGRNVDIKPRFNSFGSSINANITVSMVWKYVDVESPEYTPAYASVTGSKPGSLQQVTWWDWDTAAASIILNNAAMLQPVLGDVRLDPDKKGMIKSEMFGDVSFAELGNRVNTSEDILGACTRALTIPEHVAFSPGSMDNERDIERLESLRKTRKAEKAKKGKQEPAGAGTEPEE